MFLQKFTDFIHLSLKKLIISSSSTVINYSERDPETVETLYTKEFARWSFRSLIMMPPKSYDVCNFVKEEKIALCEIIFKQTHYSQLNIHLGKAAFYNDTAECEEKELTFHFKTSYNKKLKRKMFPCYGVHIPVRSNWYIDDYFDAYYVSQGPNENTLFIYAREKKIFPRIPIPSGNIFINYYSPVEYININVYNIIPVIISHEDYIKELASRKLITFNRSIEENEINYVREIIDEHLQSHFICKLEKKIKLLLCQKIFNRSPYQDFYAIDETAMFNNSVQCESKRIIIQSEDHLIFSEEHMMYPCYGYYTHGNFEQNDSITFYLAEGYRNNSVLVFNQKLIDNSYFRYQIFEFIENVFLRLCTVTMRIQKNTEENEKLYVETIIRAENKPDTLCDLPKEKKMGICEAFLLQPYYTNTLQISFNKSAAYFLTADCIESSITLEFYDNLNENKPKQRMFPCYARSNPMRTDWIVDERFDKFFISSGPENDSLIVYEKYKRIRDDDDVYMINEIMWDVGIENIISVSVSREEMNEELKLLEIISCNSDRRDIEKTMLREMIENNVQILDTICHFESEYKYSLCKTIINHCCKSQINSETIIWEPTECEEKLIRFNFETNYLSNIALKVLPCKFIQRIEVQEINVPERGSSHSNEAGDDSIGSELDTDLSYVSSHGHISFSTYSNTGETASASEVNDQEIQPLDCISTNSSINGTEDYNVIYLSMGYRPNSVIIYKSANDDDLFQDNSSKTSQESVTNNNDEIVIYKFVENLNFT